MEQTGDTVHIDNTWLSRRLINYVSADEDSDEDSNSLSMGKLIQAVDCKYI
jgi:hypothetical protein